MLIGELSKKTGLSKDTIRFYEKMGLITASDRQAGTRIYKEFAEETADRLLMINQGKKLGFKLKEIRQLLDEWGNASMSKQEQIKVIKTKHIIYILTLFLFISFIHSYQITDLVSFLLTFI